MIQHDRAVATLNSIGDAILCTDLDGHVTYLNPVAETMTGWSLDAATGRPLASVLNIINRGTRRVARDPMSLAIRLNKTVGLTPDCLLIRRDGTELPIEDSAAPIHDEDGRVTGAVIVFRDVGAALETSRHMADLALHDSLTGLPNRLLLHDRLTEAIALALRHHKALAVLFIDVDGFKGVNDSMGHAAGDQVLKSLAARLSATLRLSDTVCRHSGDEFVVVLSEMERPSDAVVVVKKLLAASGAPYHVGDRDIAVTVSIGVALFPDNGENATALVTNADAAMYDAKRTGPGIFRLVDRRIRGQLDPVVH